jgi:hypothetical protein
LDAVDAPASVIVQSSPEAARAIEARYGFRTRVFFGPDAAKARINAGRMPLLNAPGDVAIYLPSAKAGILDYHVLADLGEALEGMRFVDGVAPVAEAKVVVVTGHDSPELLAYVRELGEAGALRGKLVLLNSCDGALKPELNSLFIREFGPVGIRSFTIEIRVEALRDVMVRFHDLLGSEELRGEPIERIWNFAVKLAAEKADQEGLRRQILLLLDVVTQISTVIDPRSRSMRAAA